MINIDYSFVGNIVDMNWVDIQWAMRQGIIDQKFAIEFAISRISGDVYCDEEMSIAIQEYDSAPDVDHFVNILSSKRRVDPGKSPERKWLFVILRKLYVESDRDGDVFSRVEDVYAEFNYPKAIEGFVPYMPPTDGYDPSIHSAEENRKRLLSQWASYLIEEGAALAPPSHEGSA